jgi:UDP-N-acetylmuramyl pentapeptide phosphotransferase/UDP-N-acetylglucosamine-1-phosphate transferase
MKIPQSKTGMSTAGGLGIALVVLVATNFISPWWLVLATFMIFAGIGQENGSRS